MLLYLLLNSKFTTTGLDMILSIYVTKAKSILKPYFCRIGYCIVFIFSATCITGISNGEEINRQNRALELRLISKEKAQQNLNYETLTFIDEQSKQGINYNELSCSIQRLGYLIKKMENNLAPTNINSTDHL